VWETNCGPRELTPVRRCIHAPCISSVSHLTKIISALPAFRDIGEVNSKPVYILKKVELLSWNLYSQIGPSHPGLFSFYDVDQLTVFADNVIPTILHHLEILPLSVPTDATEKQTDLINELKEDVTTGRESTLEMSWILRAAAMDVCDEIVKRTRERDVEAMTCEKLDAYLWREGKKSEMRDLVRYCFKDTLVF
jgi:Queuosine salvage protein